jgi:hypothetical protein
MRVAILFAYLGLKGIRYRHFAFLSHKTLGRVELFILFTFLIPLVD